MRYGAYLNDTKTILRNDGKSADAPQGRLARPDAQLNEGNPEKNYHNRVRQGRHLKFKMNSNP